MKNIRIKAALAGVLALTLSAGGALAASAAPTPAPSLEQMWLWNPDETIVQSTDVKAWDDPVYGYPLDAGFSDYDDMFTGPADAAAVFTFFSNPGDELDSQKWLGSGFNGFNDPALKTVLTPALRPIDIDGLGMAAAKANGGVYSVGLAFTDGAGVLVKGVTFVRVNVAPGGNYTYTPTVEGTVDPDPTGDSKDIDISADVQEAPGDLTFTVPTTSVALTTSINAQKLSESTGSITGIAVADTRRTADRKGWDLTQSVANFVSGANTIDKANFGVKVTKTAGNAATAGTEQVAGSAVYPSPFATAGAGVSTEPNTTLNADLKLVAPAGTPAGTYTSKMTLTLVSK